VSLTWLNGKAGTCQRGGSDARQSEMCGAMDVEVRVRVFGVDVERGGLFEEKKL
jgi:hypothetical protein